MAGIQFNVPHGIHKVPHGFGGRSVASEMGLEPGCPSYMAHRRVIKVRTKSLGSFTNCRNMDLHCGASVWRRQNFVRGRRQSENQSFGSTRFPSIVKQTQNMYQILCRINEFPTYGYHCQFIPVISWEEVVCKPARTSW
jgi:hypothetical protein